MVPAYSLLLFGGTIEVLHVEKQVVVDQWVKFEAPAKIAVLFRELRTEVSQQEGVPSIHTRIRSPSSSASCAPR
jgi:sRNA-binding carbon storage regulator CsrA